jgi:hypothetical protein
MPSFSLDPNQLMTEVYSYPFPEVRQLLSSIQLDERFMLNTLPVVEARQLLESYGYTFAPELRPTTRIDGTLDLDEFHQPVQDRLCKVLGKRLQGIEHFDHRYPVSGSSPAIFHLLAEWSTKGELSSLAMLRGDYEGYRALAESLRVPITLYTDLSEARPKAGEVWFVSNPSARDGNWISKEAWESFASSGCAIVLDAAYVGLTADDHSIDVRAPTIRAVLTSPSKIFGVFRHRLMGTTFVREPVASMFGNKWFKDIPAMLATLALYERFADNWIPKQYRPWQLDICEQLGTLVGQEVQPSDTILLASTSQSVPEKFENFRRGDLYRFGLTKLFEHYERQMT